MSRNHFCFFSRFKWLFSSFFLLLFRISLFSKNSLSFSQFHAFSFATWIVLYSQTSFSRCQNHTCLEIIRRQKIRFDHNHRTSKISKQKKHIFVFSNMNAERIFFQTIKNEKRQFQKYLWLSSLYFIVDCHIRFALSLSLFVISERCTRIEWYDARQHCIRNRS